MKLTLNEIIESTGAEILKCEATQADFSFSTDTRTIEKDQIYLPLKGANFDGENFTLKALEMGAFGFFTTKKAIPEEFTSAKLILSTENTLDAYLNLARFCRRKIAPKTIAITGSSGKTTTKEMAFSVACEKFKTHKSELNFNNEIGLCKTILSMPEDTEVLILEMGMRGLGEIELLSKYSEPDIAIIANVGTAHIGRLKSRENIAKAKCEIEKYLNPNGVIIAHNDEIIKNQLEQQSKRQNNIFFSLDDAKILERKIGLSKFEYKNHLYRLNIEGDYNVQNALAVIEMGLQLKMSEQEIANGLEKFSPIEKRWEIKDINGYKVVNDSYNANPESMQGVIKTVLDIYSTPVVFVLGDMGELGEDEAEFHRQIGTFLADNLKDNVKVLTVGTLAEEISKTIEKRGFWSKNFTSNQNVSRYILDNIEIGTTIILKASRSMKFEEIIHFLDNEKTEER